MCVICHEELHARVALPCGHNNFCGQCMVYHLLLDTRCPICRHDGSCKRECVESDDQSSSSDDEGEAGMDLNQRDGESEDRRDIIVGVFVNEVRDDKLMLTMPSRVQPGDRMTIFSSWPDGSPFALTMTIRGLGGLNRVRVTLPPGTRLPPHLLTATLRATLRKGDCIGQEIAWQAASAVHG